MQRRTLAPILRFAALIWILGVAASLVVAWCCTLFSETDEAESTWMEAGHGLVNRSGDPFSSAGTVSAPNLGWYAIFAGGIGRVHAVVFYQWLDDGHMYSVPGSPRAERVARILGFADEPDAVRNGSAHELARVFEAAGWPMLAFSNELSASAITQAGVRPLRTTGMPGIQVPFRSRWFARLAGVCFPQTYVGLYPARPRQLPIQPIWFGLAVDSAFYSVLIASVAWCFRAARQRSRLRRNLCPRCAYGPLTSELCPECGESSRRSAPQRASLKSPTTV